MIPKNQKKPINLFHSWVIRCKTCGREINLTSRHLEKISVEISIEVTKIDDFILPQCGTFFRCTKCGQKNAEIKDKSKRTRKILTRKRVPRKKHKPRGPGRCIKCGYKIPAERLKIVPGTNLCTGCKRAEEL